MRLSHSALAGTGATRVICIAIWPGICNSIWPHPFAHAESHGRTYQGLGPRSAERGRAASVDQQDQVPPPLGRAELPRDRRSVHSLFRPVRRIWIRRAATSASSSFLTKYSSVVRMSAVSGEFAHLVHRGAVADRVVNRRLPQRMDADATSAEPVGIDAGGFAVLLDQPPGGLAVQVAALEAGSVGGHGPEQRPSLSSRMPARAT